LNDTRTGRYAAPFGTTDAERNHYKTDMIGGQIDYQLDGAMLSYLPSYLYLDARPLYWLSAIHRPTRRTTTNSRRNFALRARARVR